VKNYYGSSSLFVFKNIFFEGLESELLTYRRGRIALNGWANCNSPLHMRYPNVGKYYMQIASRAWHEDVCVRRRGKVRELAQRSM